MYNLNKCCTILLWCKHKYSDHSTTHRSIELFMTLCANVSQISIRRGRFNSSTQFTSFSLVAVHFFPNLDKSYLCCWESYSWQNYFWMSSIPDSWLLTVLHAPCAGALFCWMMKNSPENSRITGSIAFKSETRCSSIFHWFHPSIGYCTHLGHAHVITSDNGKRHNVNIQVSQGV